MGGGNRRKVLNVSYWHSKSDAKLHSSLRH